MILAILQARTSSKRLPNKVLALVEGRPMLAQQILRVRQSRRIDRLLVATSKDPADDSIAILCRQLELDCFRGDLNDVLDRFYQAAVPYNPDWIVRLTGDCPLADPAIIDDVIAFCLQNDLDYASNTLEPTFPDGLDVEVIRFSALKEAWKNARLPSEREHVTPYIYKKPSNFRIGNYAWKENLSHLRWTVDEPQDLEFVRRVYAGLAAVRPDFSFNDVLEFLARYPEISKLNHNLQRNEGYMKSLENDLNKRYQNSILAHERAKKTIPLGSQTFSKSITQYPKGAAPLFLERGKGARVWDVDGNEYIDFVNSLAAITIGYADPEIDRAVREQIEKGVILSLPNSLEYEVSEKMNRMIPCAEMVRFGKNGSDATAGAVRLARAYTGRDRVAVCGYHGWQDWYIGSTARNRGVPKSVRELTHAFTYNDIESLRALFKRHPGEIAAVIMEPMGPNFPQDHFLEKVQELCNKENTLLVFDETITGFRFGNGGAQEYFGIVPDLATFGKGIANGYPLSAITGKAEYMRLMDEIFFSFTFGGELLSLAAAKATLERLEREPILKEVSRRGERLLEGANQLLRKHEIGDLLETKGHPAWSFLVFKDYSGYSQFQVKTLFLQEMFRRGILVISTHNLSYSHEDREIDLLLRAYDEVFPILKSAVYEKRMDQLLCVPPLESLFKIR